MARRTWLGMGGRGKNDTCPGIRARVTVSGTEIGRGLASYSHVPCSPSSFIPLFFLLLRSCRPALSHAILRQRRHHILPHSPTQRIHHRRTSGRLGFHMVNTDVRYKHPWARFNTLSQPSACLQTISIPGTRVLCHEYFPQVHPHSHACV